MPVENSDDSVVAAAAAVDEYCYYGDADAGLGNYSAHCLY